MSGGTMNGDLGSAKRAPSAGGERSASEHTVWTSLELVKWTTGYFSQAGIASPRLDAEVLLAHVLGCRRLDLYLQFERPVEPPERARYRALVQRRARDRVPVAQLIGEREFWSHSFRVTPDVLTPRPETELLVELAARLAPRRVLDFGTGSGNIAISIALEVPGASVVAVDRSQSALRVARENVERHGVSDRVSLVAGSDLGSLTGRFDVIVSNPPYIASGDLAGLAPELSHEPRLALDGGVDGLDVVRELFATARHRLVADGFLMIEIGAGQATAVAALASEHAAEVELHEDLAGIERVVCARFKEGAMR